MCGVIGFVGEFDEHEKTILSLIDQSSIRGTHSYGVSFFGPEGIRTKKFHVIEEAKTAMSGDRPNHFIFHNRYSTTGDWKHHDNNQPVVIENASLVFNGVISQASRERNQEKYKLSLETTNDGEILLRQEDKEGFVRKCRGSLAGLLLEDSHLHYFRNERRPLWIHEFKKKGFIIASTADILARSGVAECEPVQVGYWRFGERLD